MTEPSNETLAAWLGPVTLTPDAEGVKAYNAAVGHALAKSRSTKLLDVIALAHAAGTPETNAWFTELARVKQPDLPLTANDELVSVLAAAVVVRALTSANGPRCLVGLGVHSAGFVGLTPVRPEVTAFADSAVAQLADATRRRALKHDPIAPKVAGWVNEGNDPGQPASSRSEWEHPIVRAAEALDAFATEIRDRLGLLDEEYNLLWWSHADRSSIADAPWGKVDPPARRAVLVAAELEAKLTHIPATPMVDGLAAVALGDAAKKSLSLADIVAVVREVGVTVTVAGTQHTLLPISTGVAQAAKYDDDTWIKVVRQIFKVDMKDKHEATAIARQLIRECQIGELL